MNGRPDLSDAHRGYAYQDLLAAVACAMLLGSPDDRITVDRKETAGDVFDDITLRRRGHVSRRQIKFAAGENRMLRVGDFANASSRVRIDKLVSSWVDTVSLGIECEPRLAVAWASPTEPDLTDMLTAAAVEPSVPGSRTQRFRLKPDTIWPVGEEPSWQLLRSGQTWGRPEFVAFAHQFVIETEMPLFSQDLRAPGELEHLFFRYLTERVGIGTYPNAGRTVEDVGARLINLATRARTERLTLSGMDVAHAINLRVDYGQVPQASPIELEHLVDRVEFVGILQQEISASSTITVIGPPGSGKSWSLSVLADALKKEGVLVARHYCYLRPGDEDEERRITTNVMFGNLIGDLVAADSGLAEEKERVLAADSKELVNVLAAAARKRSPSPVVLIVDGIDHISRVLSKSPSVRAADTDIVEELAALDLPTGVCLVLGSQPGPHLNPLRGRGLERTVPHWQAADLALLADRFFLREAIDESEDYAELMQLLAGRASGNPLYATFLIRGIKACLAEGDTRATDWLTSAPELRGQIAEYYEHLYNGIDNADQTIPQVLGVIDFAVTEEELGGIVGPLVSQSLGRVLRILRPILVEIVGQGGLRIFHESFRRFITERLVAEGISSEVPLVQVVEWLRRQGFPENPKTYRHLLPALRRAGRIDEVLACVGPDFVSASVAWGYTRDVIQKNLSLAAETAAAEQRWPALVRCSELFRALHTCFEEHMLEPFAYWQDYVGIMGAERAADRMLYEGAHTLDRHLGLWLCSLIDDAGGSPPWDVYLGLPLQPFAGGDGSDGAIEWRGKVVAAILHGTLRRDGAEEMLSRARKELVMDPQSWEPPVVVAMAERLVKSAQVESVQLLAGDEEIPSKHRALLWLAIAREARRREDIAAASEHAERAVGLDGSISVVEEALLLGARMLPADYQTPDPDAIDIELDSNNYHVRHEALSEWVSCVRIVSFRDPASLERMMNRLEGAGWYRSWLRYVVQVSRAETLRDVDARVASQVAVRMFGELARDANPVLGRPRAMDLVMARGTIRSTLARGLALLDGDEDWSSALASLAAAVDGTESHVSGTPWGPIHRDTVVALLEPFLALRPELKPILLTSLERQLRAAEEEGEFFSTHADLELAAVRTLLALGENESALEHWRQAAVYLTAYGQRKDVTLYELIGGLPALTSDERLEALERLFLLAWAVFEHTDKKGTRGLPNACLRELAAASPSTGLQVAAFSQIGDGGRYGWIVDEAAHDTIMAARGQVDPRLLVLALETLPFIVDYAEEAKAEVVGRLAAIEDLAAVDRESARNALLHLAARVEGDHHEELLGAAQPINDLACRLGVAAPLQSAGSSSEGGAERSPNHIPSPGPAAKKSAPVFVNLRAEPPPPHATPVHLMTWIRKNVPSRYDEQLLVSQDELVNRVGYACLVLSDEDKEDAAIRLLRFVLRHAGRYDPYGAPVLVDLGEGFQRSGRTRLAAAAMTLAFIGSRGGHGWDSIGGDEHAGLLERAVSTDPLETRRTFAASVTALIPSGYVTGVTPGVIKRLRSWGEAAVAGACWREAYEVIRHRLPSKMAGNKAALQFRRSEIEPWSPAEATVGLIVARASHLELARKRSALLALAQAIRNHPDVVAAPLATLLSRDGTPTSCLLLLAMLWETEDAPFVISKGIRDQLEALANVDLYAERTMARRLLERAGLGAPASVPPAPALDHHAEGRHVEMALTLDWGDRVEQVSKLWPEFPEVLTRRFEQEHFESPTARSREKDRYEYSGRRGSSMPYWVRILGWEKEIFELVFQETLNGVRPYLWSQGESTVDLDRRLLSIVLPRIRLQLALEASRSVRPKLPRPTQTDATEASNLLLPDDDEYAGWHRLGWYEEELVFGNHHSPSGDPVETVRTVVGAVAGLSAVPEGALPFGSALPEAWFLEGAPTGPAPVNLRGIAGAVVGAAWLDDLLGVTLILVPPPALAVRCGLRPGPWPGPLQWLDEEGKPAIVLRVWRVRSINRGSEGPWLFEGSELLVRPELYARIELDSGYSLRLVRRTLRNSLSRRRDDS